ncbi:DUF6507 family protein [Curtobacterium sp. PhB136]|uniref:DUF6507 family protein n=1 Tax=Curtobacterium sp. PhB136 TaxID=2485181 RepID=UPI001044D403|nr:DUF6507 family protein [Curtobacterium sp. PhB136]TCK63854.1 hypothetical protein EDF27_2405 [Curtobacterium sp. PhB136]
MTSGSWKIDPAGVRSVLDGMQTSLDGTAAALQSVQTGVTDASGGAGAVVNEALGAFVDQVSDDVDQVTFRLIGGVQGVHGAVDAYVRGDLEMAAASQRAGITAHETHDVSLFVRTAGADGATAVPGAGR